MNIPTPRDIIQMSEKSDTGNTQKCPPPFRFLKYAGLCFKYMLLKNFYVGGAHEKELDNSPRCTLLLILQNR